MRDYAKKDSLLGNANRQPSSRRPKRSAPKPPKQSFRIPAWVWMLAGLLIGVILVIVGWTTLHHHKTQKPHKQEEAVVRISHVKKVTKPEVAATKTQSTEAKPAKQQAQKIVSKPQHKKTVAAKPKPAEPQFDFYSILPNRKVDSGAKPGDQQAESNKQFMLQVASYRDQKDAKAMKARLLLLGLKPSIDQVGAEGNIWYRVDLGPYPSVRKADVVRHTLQNGGVNGAMIRQVAGNKSSN